MGRGDAGEYVKTAVSLRGILLLASTESGIAVTSLVVLLMSSEIQVFPPPVEVFLLCSREGKK